MAAKDNIVGEVGLRVTPVDPGFNAGVKKIIDKIENGPPIKININADTSQATAAADQLIAKGNQVADSWVKSGIQVAAFTAAIYTARAAVDQLINKFAGLFDQLLQAQAGFTSILKSEGAGNRLLEEIQEFARVSPFVTQELVNYSQQLLGVGVASEKIVPLLQRTGDIISSVGGDTQNIGRVLFTLTQIQSIGRLTGQDAIQLQSALIPITKYLADYLGKTTAQVKKMQEAGSISAETVFAAISAQGEKVEGAMDNATRTIGGAKSVLSDTVTIFLQQQPVLQKINDDIIQGIKGIANALGEPDFQQAAAAFFTQIDRIYQGLQPFIESLISLGEKGGLSSLSVLTQVMSVLATVLESIPVGALEAFATVFAAISIIKAPLLLLTYIDKLGVFTKGLVGVGQSAITASKGLDVQTDAIKRQAAAEAELAAARAKSTARLQAAGVAAVIAGSTLNDGQGGSRELVGSVLTGAGTGAALGAGGGPVGAAIGAGIGGGLSLVAFQSKFKREAKAAAEATAEEAAETFATAFSDNLAGRIGGFKSTTALSEFFDEVSKNQVVIDNYNQIFDEMLRKSDAGLVPSSELSDTADLMNNIRGEIDSLIIARDALIDSETGVFFQGIVDKLNQLDGDAFTKALTPPDLGGTFNYLDQIDTAKFTALRNVMGDLADVTSLTGADLQIAGETLADLGLTFEDVGNNSVPELDIMIARFTSMPEAFKDATTAALDFNLALEAIQKGSKELFEPFRKEIQQTAAQISGAAELGKSFGTLYEVDKKTGVSEVKDNVPALTANALGMSILNSATREYDQTLLVLGDTLTKEEREQQAQAASARTTYGEFKILQETLKLGTTEFNNYLEAAGLTTLFQSSLSAATSTTVETLDEMSERLGISKENLIEFYGIIDANDTSRIISGEGTDELLTQIARITDEIENYSGTGTDIVTLERTRVALMDQLGISSEAVTAELEKQEDLQRTIAGFFVTQSVAAIGSIQSVREFNDVLGSLYEVSDSNTLAVTGNIETITDAAIAILAGGDKIYKDALDAGSTEIEANALAASNAVAKFEAFQTVIGKTDEEFRKLLESLGLLDEFDLAITQSQAVDPTVLEGVNPDVTAQNDQINASNAKAQEEANKESDKALEDWKRSVEQATSSLTSNLESAAQEIAAAAERWVTSIKERTQYEQAVSVSRLTKNAERQSEDLTELGKGIANLRGRGVSQEVLDALGIDNVADLRQLRKLVNASDTDLGALTTAVGERDQTALELATAQEDARTRKNISIAIIEAATTLGIVTDKETAAAISNQFNITPGVDGESLAIQILGLLSGGRVG